MQQEQIKEQYELLSLTRVETVNRKILKDLDQEWLLFSESFTVPSRETITLTYDKKVIFTMPQLRHKIAILQDALIQIQFDIKNIYSYIETYQYYNLNINQPPDLQLLLFDIKDQF